MSAVALYWLFLRAGVLSLSGFATVPVLREALVLDAGVLTDARLNDAIAISQASPGPLGLYVVIVGYFVAGFQGRCRVCWRWPHRCSWQSQSPTSSREGIRGRCKARAAVS